MIEFIEKEPWYNRSPFTGSCYMYPNYIVKDGKEFFMFHRRSTQASYEDATDEARRKHLLSTGGRYFRFNGYKDDPLEMLRIAADRKHSFVNPKKLLQFDYDGCGYVDFHGNFNEVSAAFHYRIYDTELVQQIKTAAEHLIRKEWDMV